MSNASFNFKCGNCSSEQRYVYPESRAPLVTECEKCGQDASLQSDHRENQVPLTLSSSQIALFSTALLCLSERVDAERKTRCADLLKSVQDQIGESCPGLKLVCSLYERRIRR